MNRYAVILNPPFVYVHAAKQKDKTVMKSKVLRKNGFTLVEIMIVVAIIGLLAAIAIPNFVRARVTSQQNACINNLRLIDGAKQQWALENKKVSTSVPVSSDLAPYLGRGTGTVPTCPVDPTSTFDTSYSPNSVSVSPSCLIAGTATVPHALP